MLHRRKALNRCWFHGCWYTVPDYPALRVTPARTREDDCGKEAVKSGYTHFGTPGPRYSRNALPWTVLPAPTFRECSTLDYTPPYPPAPIVRDCIPRQNDDSVFLSFPGGTTGKPGNPPSPSLPPFLGTAPDNHNFNLDRHLRGAPTPARRTDTCEAHRHLRGAPTPGTGLVPGRVNSDGELTGTTGTDGS